MSDFDNVQPISSFPGIKKASILLVALGTKVSASVLQQLTPLEIERLTAEIVLLNRVDPDLRQQVLDECVKELSEDVGAVGAEYARELLEQVFGEVKATELLGKVSSGGSAGDAFRWLQGVPSKQLAECLQAERPQVIALVMGHLDPSLAAEILAELPQEIQGEVALRLTTMAKTDPEVVKNVSLTLLQKLSTVANSGSDVGGSKVIVEILNNIDRSTEKKILDYIADTDEEAAKEIKDNMFVFEDVLKLDDRSIQIVLRDVPQEDLRLALKNAEDEVKDVFFRNMSQRAAETLKEDLEASAPTKKRDIEKAQSRIANIARQLAAAGEISIGSEEEEMVA